jgi:protein-tyrosine phosphatase
MESILFVCTGNVFRSLTAELALAREISSQGRESTFSAASAGIGVGGALIVPELREIWAQRGLDPGDRGSRPVTSELLENAIAVVSMARNHQEALHSTFGCTSDLFNQLALGEDLSVDDVGEAMPDHRDRPGDVRQFMADTVDHILKNTPALFSAVLSKP